MPPHLFFTSYARLDNQDGKLDATIKALSKRLAAKLGEEVSVFFDTTDLQNGVEWQTAMAQALRELRLIVCLCSPSYVKSAFCAKEFDVFRQRVDDSQQNSPAIIPIVWEPLSVPQVISRFFQPKDPRFPSDYYVAGLYQLSRLPSQQENYLLALEALANDINAADASSKLQPWNEAVEYDRLPNFFHNPKPGVYGVSVRVLNAKASQWKAGNARSTVGLLVDEVTRALSVPWEDMPPNLVTLSAELAQAKLERLVSLLIVSEADLNLSPWQEMLQVAQQAGHDNVMLLIGSDNLGTTSVVDRSRSVSADYPGMAVDHFALGDQESFKSVLTKGIATLRIALVKQDEAAKVIAPELREAALSSGIPVDSLTTLKGPGGVS